MGAPKIEVTAFIGSVKLNPGICEIKSQTNINKAPINKVPKNKVLCKLVLKSIFAKWGTARPTNAIGPAKAVMLPAKILVEKSIIYLDFFIL